MSKQVSKQVSTGPASMQDAGYRFAQSGETMESIARYVLEQCPTILTDVPKEIKAQLYAGFQLRKHELVGEKIYKLGEGGTYIPLTNKPENVEGIVCFTVNLAMSYGSQEFGKMRETDPSKHAAIRPLRDAFSTYASNSMADLIGRIRRIVNDGKTRQRAANKTFTEAMTEAFSVYEKRVRTAHDRSETDADPVKFRVARDAFWKAYNA